MLTSAKIFSDDDSEGYNTNLRFAKVSGKIRYRLENTLRSEDYDPTDLGFQQTNNQNINLGLISYNPAFSYA